MTHHLGRFSKVCSAEPFDRSGDLVSQALHRPPKTVGSVVEQAALATGHLCDLGPGDPRDDVRKPLNQVMHGGIDLRRLGQHSCEIEGQRVV